MKRSTWLFLVSIFALLLFIRVQAETPFSISGTTPPSSFSGAITNAIGVSPATAGVTNGVLTIGSTSSSSTFSPEFLRLTEFAGYGSGAGAIPYFTTTITNTFSASTGVLTMNATTGTVFKVMKSGTFNLSMNGQGTGAIAMGFSLNSAQGGVAVYSINATNRLGMAYSTPANSIPHFSVTVSCVSNDVIRPHTDGSPAADGTTWDLSITKVQ